MREELIESLFCEIINQPNNTSIWHEFANRLHDNVTLSWGSGVMAREKDQVLSELMNIAKAFSSPEGFTAELVCVLGCDLPGFEADNNHRYHAVVFYSKLEPYSSWTFVLDEDDANHVTAIRGAKSDQFCLFRVPVTE